MVLPEQQLQEAITVTGNGYHAERIRSFFILLAVHQSVSGRV
jgi:hypothetical protein